MHGRFSGTVLSKQSFIFSLLSLLPFFLPFSEKHDAFPADADRRADNVSLSGASASWSEAADHFLVPGTTPVHILS